MLVVLLRVAPCVRVFIVRLSFCILCACPTFVFDQQHSTSRITHFYWSGNVLRGTRIPTHFVVQPPSRTSTFSPLLHLRKKPDFAANQQQNIQQKNTLQQHDFHQHQHWVQRSAQLQQVSAAKYDNGYDSFFVVWCEWFVGMERRRSHKATHMAQK